MGPALAWMGTHVLESVLIASTAASTAATFMNKPKAPSIPTVQPFDKTTPMEEEEVKPLTIGEEADKRKALGKAQFQTELEKEPKLEETTGVSIKSDKPTGVQF